MKENILEYIRENDGVSLVDIFNMVNKNSFHLLFVVELEKENKIELITDKGYIIKD